MKNQIINFLAFVVIAFAFSSCGDNKIESCIEDMVGTYSGDQMCDDDVYPYSGITVSQGSESDKISIDIYDGYAPLTATVDEDCNFVLDGLNILFIEIGGSGSFDGTTLTLTTTQTALNYTETCTAVLTK